MNTPARTRFWNRVSISNPKHCWTWKNAKNKNGYGVYRANKKQILAHRMAWILTGGSIQDGLFVLHRCDNPPCCNPAHLFLGTQADNVRDMRAKGRHSEIVPPHGEAHPNAKLTDQTVADIRAKIASGESISALSERYGVSRMTMKCAVYGKTWKHVPPMSNDTRKRNKQGRPYTSLGMRHANSKLTDDIIRTIRVMYASGTTQTDIARKFGIIQGHVSHIVLRKSWAHVQD